jgi:hypothetical protein
MRAFISYSHRDADLLDLLHQHLSALRRQEKIITWTDREIAAGGIIDEEVADKLEEAELYLLLVSAAFIDSNYCYEKEFRRALARQQSGQAIIVPIILRPCDWKLPELQKFKALPDDARPVTGRDWHNADEAMANVASGLRHLIIARQAQKKKPAAKSPKPKNPKFTRDERHITDEQRAALRSIGDEVIERLTVKAVTLPEEKAKGAVSRSYAFFWSDFNKHFGITENGLASLPLERFEDAKRWLLQYRASKDKNLKRANPQKYRNTLTRTIFSVGKGIGWTNERIHTFAAEVLELQGPVGSLSDLSNKQLERVRDRVRYESTKLKVKSARKSLRQKTAKAPRLTVGGLWKRTENQKTDAYYAIAIELRNEGSLSARSVRVRVEHPESGCIPLEPNPKRWEHEGDSFGLKALNPWQLRLIGDLHPDEKVPVLTIPCSKKSTVPFRVDVEIWAEDYPHSRYSATIDESDLELPLRQMSFIT